MRKIIYITQMLAFILCAQAAYSQGMETITGKTITFIMPKKADKLEPSAELKKEVENKELIIQQKLETYINMMLADKKLTENVQTSVNVNIVNEVNTEGKNELNLHAKYNYEIIDGKDRLKAEIDDYPPGKYKLGSSNAAKSTMQILKETVEGNLADILKPGVKVTIRITGTTDGTPVSGTIPYTNDFGSIEDFTFLLNNNVSSISVNQEQGIKSNEQLGLLRTFGVRQFMETYIEPLKKTTNSYEHIVEVGKPGDAKTRRVSIELIVHDAFKNYEPRK